MNFSLLLSALVCISFLSFSQNVRAEIDSEQSCIDQASTLVLKLKCIRGLTVGEGKNTTSAPNAHVYDLHYVQPINHFNPGGGTFTQRIILIHRDETQPMVLQTSGYFIFGIEQTEITALFETNQLQVEHRYFGSSKPTPVEWSHLNILQSAADFHRITVALKKIYKARWVNTGASKGGMTSVYHRRFYPADLDGTLADVAPMSFAKADPRYMTFVENVGGEKYRACRAALKAIQISLLKNAAAITPTIGGSYSQLGSREMAFEHAVSEMPFTFWQYQDPNDQDIGCQKIPVGGTPAQQFAYLKKVNSLTSYADKGFEQFMPYFYQVATQLGGPDTDRSYLAGLLKFPFSVDQYTPKGVPFAYSNTAMIDVNAWVQTKSDRMMYIYGELDPWSAGAQALRQDAVQRYRFIVPGGNHGSTFLALPNAEKTAAIAILSRWLNKNPVNQNSRAQVRTLEQIEHQFLRYYRP